MRPGDFRGAGVEWGDMYRLERRPSTTEDGLDETALKAVSHHGSTFYEHQKFNAAVRGVGPVEGGDRRSADGVKAGR